MDSYRQTKFVVKCAVLMIFVNFCCGILVPLIMSVINNAIADNDVQSFVGSQSTQSFFSWLVTTLLLCWVLWEDGRKNTAYGCCDLFSGIMCFAAVFFVYFGPVVFMDDAGDNARVFLSRYFFTCEWIHGGKVGYTTAAMVTVLLAIALMAVSYIGGHMLYLKKHPEA